MFAWENEAVKRLQLLASLGMIAIGRSSNSADRTVVVRMHARRPRFESDRARGVCRYCGKLASAPAR